MKKMRAQAALETSSTVSGAVSYFPQPHYPTPGPSAAKSYASEPGRDRSGYAPIADSNRRVPIRVASYPYSTAPPAVVPAAGHNQKYRR